MLLPCAGAEKHLDDPSNKAGADEGLRRAFERAVYQLEASGHGNYQGANPAQRLDLDFSAREVRLKAGNPRANVGFSLTGYGYGRFLRPPAPAKLAGTGPRVEYQRGGITEWYVNEPRGLEQGFTLARRPGTSTEGEPLVIALGVSGGLCPVLAAEGDAVLLQAGEQTVLRYAGLHARDARGREVASRLEVREREIRLVIEDGSAEYPLVVDPVVTSTQESELTASNGAQGDLFGWSVSVSGNTAVVGAYDKTVNSNSGQGAAYVFVESGETWTQEAEITASDGAANDNFGYSVSVSGNTAVVGARYKTVNSNFEQGGAYVFVRSGVTWTQQAELTASDGAAYDAFGVSVSVSGNTAVVGAFNKTVNSNSGQGAAYVFVESGETWTQQAELTASDGARGDYFGFSVSVSGATAVVGSYNHSVGSNVEQGAAYVFAQSGATWSQQAELTASDGVADDEFGYSVSVSGNTAVVGTPFKTVDYQGAAYVFVESGETWSQQAELTASDGAPDDQFGFSVSVSGNTAVVGAYVKNFGSNVNQGAAYVFAQSGVTWSQQAELTASNGFTGDDFGSSVSVSGGTAVVGAYQKWVNSDVEQGAAYAFSGAVGPLQFYPLAPCRIADTRTTQSFTGAFGPPSLAPYADRTFPILSSGCTIPSTAQAYSLNFTVVPLETLGFLSVWPAGDPYPGVSTLNSTDGSVIANAAIVPAGASGGITVVASDPTDLIIDVNGYFAAPGASGLDFFPLTPCRIADTRSTQSFTGAFGPPSLNAYVTRDFPLATSPCLSGSEQAYSLNVTVVPPAPLGFLSVWPVGQPYPGVSTLNSPDGTTLANAAIVPVGTGGDIDVVAGNPTDLILDINGKFATPGAGGLQFYPVTPCRVADTRSSQSYMGAFGPPSLAAYVGRNFPIQSSSCGIPATVQAYALNMTVVPSGTLSFLSAWPAGQPYPGVSTLNSPDGFVIANAAIVPAGTGAAITVLAGNPTDLIIDIVGYFAP